MRRMCDSRSSPYLSSPLLLRSANRPHPGSSVQRILKNQVLGECRTVAVTSSRHTERGSFINEHYSLPDALMHPCSYSALSAAGLRHRPHRI